MEFEGNKIEELANEIEDVTDPSSYDKVLIYYEQLQSEAEEFIEVLIKQLKDRDITWEQPWYQSTNCGLTIPHKPLYDRNQDEKEQFRTDKFTIDEKDKIIKNWNRFIKKYKVPDQLRQFVIWKNDGRKRKGFKSPEERARRFVTAYLARGLERNLHQVYHYIRFFHLRQLEKKVYNKHEEKIMETCFLHKQFEASPMLAHVLGRHRRGIYKRLATTKSGKIEKKRQKWTLQDASKLVRLILEHANVPLDDLKNVNFTKPFWSKLEEPMERHYTYLHFFWYAYLHVQIFVKSDVKLNKLRRKLFLILHDSDYKVWADIKWDEILKHFPDGFTRLFLNKMCSNIVRKQNGYSTMPLKALAMFGLDELKTKRYSNKRLRRLTLEIDGNLRIISPNGLENGDHSQKVSEEVVERRKKIYASDIENGNDSEEVLGVNNVVLIPNDNENGDCSEEVLVDKHSVMETNDVDRQTTMEGDCSEEF